MVGRHERQELKHELSVVRDELLHQLKDLREIVLNK
jgi:hypothetical protein